MAIIYPRRQLSIALFTFVVFYLTYSHEQWQEDKPCPTNFLFASEARARAFREENEFDLSEEDFEGLVLVRRTTMPMDDKAS